VLDVSFFRAPPRFGDVALRPKTPAQEQLFAEVMFGSVAELVNQRLEAEELRTSLAMLAISGNFLGPSSPGSAYQLMQRPLYRGARALRGRAKVQLIPEFANRAPFGGMGAITQSMENSVVATGVRILKDAEVSAIKCGPHGVEGVLLSTGEEFDAPVVVSNVNPKKTLLEFLPEHAIDAEFRERVRRLDMRGSMGKVILALDGKPRFASAKSESENEILMRCGFRAGSTVEAMDCAYAEALRGSWRGDPVIYGLTQSAFDPDLTPNGKHIMSLSVSYAPYDLAADTWELERDNWAKHVIRGLAEYIPNLCDLILDYRCLCPKDLEDEFGLLQGNALHGDVMVARMYDWRPIAGYSDYTTPVDGLYLCGNGTWPANYVCGLPGHNAAAKVIADTLGTGATQRRGRKPRLATTEEAAPMNTGIG
jgi:phytoene dehydrogenase-like protein